MRLPKRSATSISVTRRSAEPPADSAARLVEVDDELARLRSQHDLAMSAFRFDEARALQSRVAALEDERRALAVNLPPTLEPPSGVVQTLARPRRGLRQRPRRRR